MSAIERIREERAAGFFRRLLTPTPKRITGCRIKCVSAPEQEEQAQSVQGRGKKVLIVDDDQVILKTASMKLQANGYKVTTASDGSEAIRLVRDVAPDLILLDINFPPEIGGVPWDGFSLLHWLRNLREANTVPVIMITSDAAPHRERAVAMGALGILSKPLDYTQLLAQMQQVLEGRIRLKGEEPGFPI